MCQQIFKYVTGLLDLKTETDVDAVVLFENQTSSWTLDSLCNMFTVESFSIWQALLLSKKKSRVVCTDSLSKSIQNIVKEDHCIYRILELTGHLNSRDKEVIYLWG